jgi:LAO/AO transport system kinase
MRSEAIENLAQRVIAGEVRALARACRLIDDRVPGHRELLRALFPHAGHAWIVGITGTPGAGKSTLTDCLVREFRARGQRVGVLAVDPTSPFTGGAVLGDRVRMQRHFEDPEVFIRSAATRGALGGLSRSAADLIRAIAAWQANVVLVETVGVGQDELEVTRAAHTTLVVVPPGLGDDVQAAKAGILECADVFAVNKADREGADATARDLAQMINLGRALAGSSAAPSPFSHGLAHAPANSAPADGGTSVGWVAPVIRCIATRGDGIRELMDALHAHRDWLRQSPLGAEQSRVRARAHLLSTLRDALSDEALERLDSAIEDAVRRVQNQELDPYSACDELVARLTRA